MGKQAEAWARYDRFDPNRVMPKAQLWTTGYFAASIPMAAILERLEWSGETYCNRHGKHVPMCPICAACEHDGHAVGCELDAYLSEERNRRENWGETEAVG